MRIVLLRLERAVQSIFGAVFFCADVSLTRLAVAARGMLGDGSNEAS